MSEQLYRRCRRCFKIVEFLAEEREVARQGLAELCACSIRTIAEDVKFLREVGFDIRYVRSKERYELQGELPFPALKRRQMLELFLSAHILTLSDARGDAPDALLATLSEADQRFARSLTDRVCMAPRGKMRAPDILLKVYRAVAECRTIEIEYQRFSTRALEQCCLEPYGIYLNYRGDPYVVGKSFNNASSPGYRRFKVCRIVSLTVLGTFAYPAGFSIRDEMRNGFWSGAESEKPVIVTLRFTPAVAQLVYEREPEDMIAPQPDGSLLVRKTTRHVKELLWEVLSYEANVEVLAPAELRELVQKTIEQMRQVYERGLDITRKWQDA